MKRVRCGKHKMEHREDCDYDKSNRFSYYVCIVLTKSDDDDDCVPIILSSFVYARCHLNAPKSTAQTEHNQHRLCA